MDQYNFNIAKYGTHSLIACEMGDGKTILDVGCNKGYLKKLAQKNEFWGVDFDENDLKIAKKENGYQEVFKLDLNNYFDFNIEKKFDAIVFADVLEHLLYPEKVLKYFVENYLKKDGKIIVSLPNVANFSVRFNLLSGKFDYTESGILDRTHLHLYTRKTGTELIKKCGLKIVKEKFSSNNFGLILKSFPFLGSFLGYNLIFICKRKY